MKLSSETGG
uniref:Uncharacterized protein n=1 Tax=Rhizophora mucronata TaxID=61149 RepID=A0A2P2PG67_RHIMU